jgi:HK97 family phage portal protein
MRGLFGRMAAPHQRASAGVPTYGMIPPLGSVPSASGILVSQATAMCVSAVYAAVTILATDVARCTASLYSTQDDGTRVAIKPKAHPVARLLKRPNRIQTWFEFCRDLMIGHLLRGNGYAVILRDSRGDPAELLLVNPDAVMMLEAADGSIFYNINRIGLFQLAMLRNQPVAVPAEDVLHLRGPSFNMLIGASTIGLARDTIGLATGQSQQQSRWIGNGARPSVVLQSPRTLTTDAAKRLRDSWNDYAHGLMNVGKTAVLEDGIEAKQLSLTSVDLQFIDQCNLTIQDVARFYNVPIRKLQQPDTTRGSTIIQEEQVYVNSAVSPKLEMIEQKLEQTFDLDNEGLEVDLNEDALLRADPLTRYNLGRIGKLSGLISTNEWRRGERLPPDPNGNALMQPVNMAALGSDMNGQAPDAAGRPPAGQMPAEGVPTGATPDSDSVGPEQDVAPEG